MHFTCLIFKNFEKILGRENFGKSIRLLRSTFKFLNCLMKSGLLRTSTASLFGEQTSGIQSRALRTETRNLEILDDEDVLRKPE